MVRNLDNRIEVTVPILDPDIQKELKEILQIQLKDNTKARIIDSEMKNNYVRNKSERIRAQEEISNYLKNAHS